MTVKTPDCFLQSLAQSLFSSVPMWVSCVLRDTDLILSWGCTLGRGWKKPGLVTSQICLLQDARGRPRGAGCRGALSDQNTGKHGLPSESMGQAWWDSAQSQVFSVYFKGKSSKFMNVLGRQMIEKMSTFFKTILVILLQSTKKGILKSLFVFPEIGIFKPEWFNHLVKCPSMWT